MAKMIITQSQLKAINEVSTDGGEYTNIGDVQAKVPTIPDNGSITFRNTNNPTGSPVTMSKDDFMGNNATLTTQDNNQINNASTFTLTNESRYTKRQIELARLLEMRKNGKVYSKKQLNEMFMETQENAERLRDGIGDCDIFQVIDAVDEFFPEESENFKEALHNGADLAEYLCSIFSNGKVDANKEEEFLDSLGL